MLRYVLDSLRERVIIFIQLSLNVVVFGLLRLALLTYENFFSGCSVVVEVVVLQTFHGLLLTASSVVTKL